MTDELVEQTTTAALERHDVDHGRRPLPGRDRLRRRRAALLRLLLRALGHARGRQPALRGVLDGNAGKYFTVVLSLAISTTTISYLLVFPAIIKLAFGNAGAWIVRVLCTLWAALATMALLYPGFGTSDPARRRAATRPRCR